MNFVISTAIGGQVTNEPNVNIMNININMIKRLKSGFENIEFAELDKIKINLYISGDVSEYCYCAGIKNVRYIKNKKEISSEFCIPRTYWDTLPELCLEEKFFKFIYLSLFDLGLAICAKLKSNNYIFDKEKYNNIIAECFSRMENTQNDIFFYRPTLPYIDTAKTFTIKVEGEHLRVKNENINCLFGNLDAELFDYVYNEFNKYLNLDFSPLKMGDKEYALNEMEKKSITENIITDWIFFYTVNNLEIQILRSDFVHPQTVWMVYSMLQKKYRQETDEILQFGAKMLRMDLEAYQSSVRATKMYLEYR